MTKHELLAYRTADLEDTEETSHDSVGAPCVADIPAEMASHQLQVEGSGTGSNDVGRKQYGGVA